MNASKIPHIEKALVDSALSRWRSGELVAIPTETVYGLAADATNGEAVARIYERKSRPQFNPLIVHVADAAAAQKQVEWNGWAETLAAAFWPGPLTLVLPRRADSAVSELVSAGGPTLAVRSPAHPVARQLLASYENPLAAPSANRSGRVSPTLAQHVRDEFGEGLLVVDGGPCDVGIESTVVDLSGDAPRILRPGSVTREMLANHVRLAADGGDSAGAHKSPGMLESHYAPSIPVRLNAVSVEPSEALLAFGPPLTTGGGRMLNLSAKGDLREAASNLFSHLRALDSRSFSAIAVMPVPNEGLGEAINDRLRRAAA